MLMTWSADHLGGDPLAAFLRAAGELRGAFAAEVPVAEGAPAVDRLAGLLGRPV
jgi:hypothetical protein